MNADRTTYQGQISGTGDITIAGGQRTVFDSPANNTFSGNVYITGTGTVLQLAFADNANVSQIPAASLVNVGPGAALQLTSGGNQTIASLIGSGVVEAADSNSTLSVAETGSSVFFGTLCDNGASLSFAMTGTGDVTLSGTNSYSGGTTVTGGTLNIAGDFALPSSGVLVVGRSGCVVLGDSLGASQTQAVVPALQTSMSLADGSAAVPEPGTTVLLLAGALAAAVWWRRSCAAEHVIRSS
jgi:autotransporter-associated beta strand protein